MFSLVIGGVTVVVGHRIEEEVGVGPRTRGGVGPRMIGGVGLRTRGGVGLHMIGGVGPLMTGGVGPRMIGGVDHLVIETEEEGVIKQTLIFNFNFFYQSRFKVYFKPDISVHTILYIANDLSIVEKQREK